MLRKIITIDSCKCNGCGLCVEACHEGAIKMVDGKAKLVKDDYCDGLGNCLPICPTGAITFETREAAAYDEEAVAKNKMKNQHSEKGERAACGCPSTKSTLLKRENFEAKQELEIQSELSQFPVQIKLVPVNAEYFNGANLLIAADCTAFAYGDFHRKFIKGKITLIGCPKLDDCNYGLKLTQILQNNDINSITVARMEVPCCAGIVEHVKTALKNSGKLIPWNVVTITRDGKII